MIRVHVVRHTVPHSRGTVRAVGRGLPGILIGVFGLGGSRPGLADPGITITPSIGISQAYTDNVTTGQRPDPDLVSQISPGININGETARTKINFNYQPTFNHFILGHSDDRVDQNLAGTGTITAISDELTIDFRTSANEAGANGNATNEQGIIIPAANQILYYLGTVTPHLTEHYHDIATLDLIYSVNSTNTSVDKRQALLDQGIGSTDSLGQDIDLVIGSAEGLGRLGLKLDLRHTDNNGNGPNTDSTTDTDVIGADYHINDALTLSGSIGYQNIDYPAMDETTPYHSSGVTWSLGLNFSPNAISSAQFGFGKQQGAYSPSVQVGYALGPRTTLTASYVVTVENQLSQSLQNSRFLSFDQFGNAIDSRTGLPFSSVNQSFGSQNILFRDKPAIFSISHDFTRSTLSVSAQYEDRVSLSGPSQKDEFYTATVSYTHEFTPLIQGNVRAAYTYGVSSNAGSLTIHKQGISVSAALFYQLSDSVTVSVIEDYYNNTSDSPLDGSKTQQLTVGLRKSF